MMRINIFERSEQCAKKREEEKQSIREFLKKYSVHPSERS
jgi:hypothetical protein